MNYSIFIDWNTTILIFHSTDNERTWSQESDILSIKYNVDSKITLTEEWVIVV